MKQAVQSIVRPIYQPISIYLHSRYAENHNIFTEDWDLLIILDTCRYDAMKMVSNEYDFITDIESRWSVGGNSAEWILNTFNNEFKHEISETAYVTSNPHAVTVIEEQFEHLGFWDGELRPMDERTNRWNIFSPVEPADFHTYISLHDLSIEHSEVEATYPDPRKVTDHAIRLGRSSSPNRIVLHYMPPHLPYIAHQDNNKIRLGATQNQTSFEAYLNNLRWGLNEIGLLLENIDAEQVIITSDHGENFRLRSIRSEHKPGMVTPAVRRVPWVVTTAEDTKKRDPDLSDSERSDIKSTLKALGYR
jgi:hypothetical protein